MRRRGSKGSALMLTVMMSLILLTLTAGMSFYAVAEVKQTALQQKKMQAHYIARSGAELAVKWLTFMSSDQASDFADLSFPVYSAETPFGDGSFLITIENDTDTLTVISRGRVRDTSGFVEDTVVAVVEKVEASTSVPIEYAIFGKNKITASGGGNITGDIAINSGKNGAISFSGNPSLQNCTIHIPEGANPNVVINKPHWYILPPVKSDVPPDKIYPLPQPPTAPSFPIFPTDLPDKGDIVLYWALTTLTVQGNALYNKVEIPYNGCVLTVNAPSDTVIHIRKLNISSDGKIQINGNGKVALYIDNYTGSGGFFITSQHPENVTVYWKSDFNLAAAATIGGDVHAERNISISGGASINGDIYMGGSSVNISGNAHISGAIHSGNASVALSGGAEVAGDIYTSGPNVDLSGGIKIGGSIYGGNTDIIFSGSATVERNIVTAGDTVNMSGGTDIVNGVLYAPAATVVMSGGANINGALIADTINMSGGPSITYNKDAVQDDPINVGNSTVTFEMGYWK
ncbi:DUF7305 domain-containing protein [Mahella australiensis]|uniref:DUF7305 domain-containing protein n=1 Tax=Mahella australiensis (strain DSM 15567 / CIP 107919 / 50-1 BON) TaxID=697281 RepID=F4A388_MAHA5|nr:polymer-forming cytoskeletal protein [Mahella australiensis]AEE96321.1 hypothetical protein Mahau_1124 [Mahella australiensis 50-1 BON]